MSSSCCPGAFQADITRPDYWNNHELAFEVDAVEIDVVIPTYNRCPSSIADECPLIWTLESLLGQEAVRIGRIIVVNDGSNDRTSEILDQFQTRFGRRLHVISDGTHRGSSRARNLGLQHCHSSLVLICDDDCQFTRLALAGLQLTYKLQKLRDPNCVAVHIAFYERALRPDRVVPAADIGFVDTRQGRYLTNLKCFPREYIEHPCWLDRSLALLAPLPINHLCGIFLASRQALLDCGGFPEDFSWRNGFAEELELSYRLTALGGSLYHQPDPKMFAVHYKVGWRDPVGIRCVSEQDELCCLGTTGQLAWRVWLANQPLANSGNRVDLEDWCYSKLIAYTVCFGRRSRPGAIRWMNSSWKTFVCENSQEFYGRSGAALTSREQRERIWRQAFTDSVRLLSQQRQEVSTLC